MPRFLIRIEYDGSGYVGWQRQDNGNSIQAELEAAATSIIGKREDVMVQGAGRTDAGVHATGRPHILTCLMTSVKKNYRSRSMPIYRVISASGLPIKYQMNSIHDLMQPAVLIAIAFCRAASAQLLTMPASGISIILWMSRRWKKPPSVLLASMTFQPSAPLIVRPHHRSKL